MKWIVLSSCLLFTMFIGHGRACAPGVFGFNCTNQCHCRSGNCTVFGECEDGCKDGWGGIHCNYRDAAFDSSSPLTDNNVTTCLDSFPYRLHYRFTMREETKLSWIRFNLDRQNVSHDARIAFQDSTGSYVVPMFQRVVVEGDKIDYYGSMEHRFKYIRLTFKSWEEKQSFCGMFVSGGRNVAFKQNAVASSVWGGHVAERAVDGVTDANFNHGHCASTRAQRYASFSVTPRQPIDVNFVLIYNRNFLQCRLKRFELDLRTEYNFQYTAQRYDDQEREPQLVYKVLATTFEPIRRIRLVVDPSFWGDEYRACGGSSNENVLTVCELEVYGDVMCTVGLYGYDCEKSCDPRCAWGCHVETGHCNDCAAGRSGTYCEIVRTTEGSDSRSCSGTLV